MKTILFSVLLGLASTTFAADPPPPEELTQLSGKFFELLKKDKVEQAYDELFKTSKIDSKKEEVVQIKQQTRDALKAFGGVLGFELLEQKRMGFSLMQLVYFTMHDDRPLRWRLTFYRPKDKWRLVNIQLDDQAIQFYQPPTPPTTE